MPFTAHLREKQTYKYLHIDEAGNVQLLIPLVGGQSISTDNTCCTLHELTDFLRSTPWVNSNSLSALQSLSACVDDLEFDIWLLEKSNVNPSLRQQKAGRLAQVKQYITILKEIHQSRDLSTGNYPTGLQQLLEENSNCFPMHLAPEHKDDIIKTRAPVCSFERDSRLIAEQNLAVSLRTEFYNVRPSSIKSQRQRILEAIESAKEGQQSIPIPLSKNNEFTAIITAIVANLKSHLPEVDFGRTIYKTDFTVEYLLALGTLEESSTPVKIADEILKLVVPDIYWDQFVPSPFFTVDRFVPLNPPPIIEREKREEIAKRNERAEKLSIMTQFLLAEINIYCRAKGISKENFGRILDQNSCKKELAETVNRVWSTGGDVEDAIIAFINKHRARFGLTGQLDAQSIRKRFKADYNTVKDSPHKDDFILLSEDKEGAFVAHQSRISAHFGDFLRRQFPDIYRNQGATFDNKVQAFRKRGTTTNILPSENPIVGEFDLQIEEGNLVAWMDADINKVAALLFLDTTGSAAQQKIKVFDTLSIATVNRMMSHRHWENLRARITTLIASHGLTNQQVASQHAINQQVANQRVLTRFTEKFTRAELTENYLLVTEALQRKLFSRIIEMGLYEILDSANTVPDKLKKVFEIFGVANTSAIQIEGEAGHHVLRVPVAITKTIFDILDSLKDQINCIHFSPAMARSLYLAVEARYGKESTQCTNMNKLSNANEQNPAKIKRALALLEIRYNKIETQDKIGTQAGTDGYRLSLTDEMLARIETIHREQQRVHITLEMASNIYNYIKNSDPTEFAQLERINTDLAPTKFTRALEILSRANKFGFSENDVTHMDIAFNGDSGYFITAPHTVRDNLFNHFGPEAYRPVVPGTAGNSASEAVANQFPGITAVLQKSFENLNFCNIIGGKYHIRGIFNIPASLDDINKLQAAFENSGLVFEIQHHRGLGKGLSLTSTEMNRWATDPAAYANGTAKGKAVANTSGASASAASAASAPTTSTNTAAGASSAAASVSANAQSVANVNSTASSAAASAAAAAASSNGTAKEKGAVATASGASAASSGSATASSAAPKSTNADKSTVTILIPIALEVQMIQGLLNQKQISEANQLSSTHTTCYLLRALNVDFKGISVLPDRRSFRAVTLATTERSKLDGLLSRLPSSARYSVQEPATPDESTVTMTITPKMLESMCSSHPQLQNEYAVKRVRGAGRLSEALSILRIPYSGVTLRKDDNNYHITLTTAARNQLMTIFPFLNASPAASAKAQSTSAKAAVGSATSASAASSASPAQAPAASSASSAAASAASSTSSTRASAASASVSSSAPAEQAAIPAAATATAPKVIRVSYRHDQSRDSEARNPTVTVTAPAWVQDALRTLAQELQGTQINLPNGQSRTLGNDISLLDLVIMARNEPVNTSGKIDFSRYEGLSLASVLALKDLVRQCVIVGRTAMTGYGGYGGSNRVELPEGEGQQQPVYLCDLSGLQFQEAYNTGRLVLIPQNPVPGNRGSLDALIFRQVVGEAKKTFTECAQDTSERYMRLYIFDQWHYFDRIAYQHFIAEDLVLAARSADAAASTHGEQIVFKFLQQGTGFFAGEPGAPMRGLVLGNIVEGIRLGLERLFKNYSVPQIRAIELPFCPESPEISALCQQYKIEVIFTERDALTPCGNNRRTATTNCADPHAVTGNEMGDTSVDASIATNLVDKGSDFSPLLNPAMRVQFIEQQIIVLPEMARSLYQAVARRYNETSNEYSGFNSLDNESNPDKFNEALRLLGIRTNQVSFNGDNGYIVELTKEEENKITTICQQAKKVTAATTAANGSSSASASSAPPVTHGVASSAAAPVSSVAPARPATASSTSSAQAAPAASSIAWSSTGASLLFKQDAPSGTTSVQAVAGSAASASATNPASFTQAPAASSASSAAAAAASLDEDEAFVKRFLENYDQLFRGARSRFFKLNRHWPEKLAKLANFTEKRRAITQYVEENPDSRSFQAYQMTLTLLMRPLQPSAASNQKSGRF